MSTDNFNDLQKISLELKIDVVNMLDKAGSGHIGGAFSIADVMTYLYFNHANLQVGNPTWEDRDYILLSNGHVCPILYATLARMEYFPNEELNYLRKIDHLLQGHPKINIPGIENSSGPLGHGLSQAIGIALGLKMDSKKNKVYVFMSDGEQEEGQVWEAAMSANKWGLDNLVAIIDRNKIQIEGTVEDIMPVSSLKEKYEEFGWLAMEIDGHDFSQINAAITFADKINQPVVIISHTIGGEDINFMEGKFEYHDWKGEPGDAQNAISQLKSKIENLD